VTLNAQRKNPQGREERYKVFIRRKKMALTAGGIRDEREIRLEAEG
jgi:hypothetical protein